MLKIILSVFLLLSFFSFSQVPNASFSSNPTSLCLGGTNNFTNTSSGGVAPLTYLWNFGDSTFSTLEDPSHTFTNAGTYNVTLLTTTATGLTASASQQIIVQASPIPTFVAPINSNCAPASIFFNNTTTGGATFLWNFGNGSTSNLENPPAQLYNSNGSYTVSLTVTTSVGCTGTSTIPNFITITNVAPLFSADFENGCAPLTVQFSDISTPPSANNPITSWNWNFGNGQTFLGQNPPPQNYALGFYDVSLTVTTQSGCSGTTLIDDFISVGQVNSINFTVDTTVNCIKTDFEFTSSVVVSPANPDSTLINYFWDFNDDNTSTDQNPSYQFTSDSGYFDVSLVVEYLGCRDTLVIPQMVYVNAPVAFFDLDTNLICNLPLSAAIAVVTDTSVHGLLSDDVQMIWQWGDGSPNTVLVNADLDDLNLGSTTHTYANYGTYEIQQVINNFTTGCSDTTTQFFFVSQINSDFSIPNDSICVGDTLQLTDLSDSWSSHAINSWVYNMGNTNFVNNGPNPTYVYPASGNYTISLVVTNDVGCDNSSNLQIKAIAPPFAVISTPAADEGGCSPHLVTFLNLTQNIFSNTTPLDYFSWSFTDGSPDVITSPVPNPTIANPETPITHTFIGEGVYVTTLTAYNTFGCSSSSTKEITLTKPNAFFTLDNIFCNGTILNTENLSVGLTPVDYEWYIDSTNADTLSTDLNPNTPYIEQNLAPGQTSAIHNLILIATDNNGCKDTISISFTTSIPTADFTENLPNSVACPPITGDFVDESTSYGTINTWLWDFGNGNQSGLQNPSNTYFFPGTYDLSLTITDEYGCSDDSLFSDYLTVGGPSGIPLLNYDACTQTASFYINNQSNINSALWNLGDGSTNSALSFDYVYNPGVYAPNVTLTDAAGCAVVYPAPPITVSNAFGLNALFSASPNPVNINETVTIVNQSSSTSLPITSWSWDFGNGSTSTLQNPPTTSYPLVQPYTITLTIENDSCTSTFSVDININPDIVPVLPNVFTPNGDNENPFFELDADYFSSYVFTVMNRWGNTVFEKERDPDFPEFLWDGKSTGGEDCKDGVYFYRLKGKLSGGTEFDKTDFITLIR